MIIQEFVSSIQDIALNHTAALSHEFTCIDFRNTGRLTLSMLSELMQRWAPLIVLLLTCIILIYNGGKRRGLRIEVAILGEVYKANITSSAASLTVTNCSDVMNYHSRLNYILGIRMNISCAVLS